MIEKTVLDYLNTNLSIPVYMEVPGDPPDTFVTIEKTGAGKENQIQTATFAVQSWAPSMLAAATLNETVKDLMFSIVAIASISKSALNSDYNYTDTGTKFYRYQAVFDLVYKDD